MPKDDRRSAERELGAVVPRLETVAVRFEGLLDQLAIVPLDPPRAAPRAPRPKGFVRDCRWRLVYKGDDAACYTIEHVGGADGVQIEVEVDGTVEDTLEAGESTDVCGKKIRVHGKKTNGDGKVHWRATEIR